MDRASRALAQGTPHGVRNTWRARAEYHKVARSTLNARALDRRSKEEKAQSQQSGSQLSIADSSISVATERP